MDSSKFWQKKSNETTKEAYCQLAILTKTQMGQNGEMGKNLKTTNFEKKKANFRSIFDPRSGKMACCRSRLQLSSKIERSILFQSNIFCELDFVQWPICELHRTLSSPACR